MDYVKFCRMVMGSSGESSETSLVNDAAAKGGASAAYGNSDAMLRRKIRERWKDLIAMFKHKVDADGNMTPKQLADILYKHDIIMSDKQFSKMVSEMDKDGDGELSYNEFLAYFGPGQKDEKNVTAVIHETKKFTVGAAILMIREKTQARLHGGPGGLRAAYKFYDRSGDGKIDYNEFKLVLHQYLGVDFSPDLLAKIMAKLDDDGAGFIDVPKFNKNLMGSSQSDQSSMSNLSAQNSQVWSETAIRD